METRTELFIGGEWVPSRATDTIEVISPNSEEVIGTVPDASPEDMDLAVAAARRAFDDGPWPQMDPSERADALARLSAAVMARGQELADCISAQNGSPAKWSFAGQVLSATMVLDTYADLARTYAFTDERIGGLGEPVRVHRAPVGVAAGIIPWNVPLFIMAMKLGPAMAAGVPIVLKPAPETPLDAYLLAEAILEAELPPGAVNIVAAGRETGEHLVRHPGIDKVAFTGSTSVGRHIGALCGGALKRFSLELGGKSAAIVLDDVDLDAKLGEMLDSGLMNNGQACGAQTRFLIPRSRYNEITDAMGQAIGALTVGDSLDPATDIGPLVAERQRDRVLGYLEAGKASGARVVTGGGAPSTPERGWFVEPTLFAEVDNAWPIAQEEIFGPVLCAIPYDNEEHAVSIANDSPYGLCGSVWTGDVEHGAQLARQVRTGCVAVNTGLILDFRSPFGGFKDSGMGRELGPEGIDEYTELQSVILPG